MTFVLSIGLNFYVFKVWKLWKVGWKDKLTLNKTRTEKKHKQKWKDFFLFSNLIPFNLYFIFSRSIANLYVVLNPQSF